MEAQRQLKELEDFNNVAWCKAACRNAFRLAQYSDSQYASVVSQMKSPEWTTALAVTAHKRQQVCI